MNQLRKQFANKNVLVFGLGLQGGGVGDALYLHKLGAKVKVTDKKTPQELASSLNKLPKEVSLSLGGHEQSDIDWSDIILKNPAVPDDNELLVYANSQNKQIIMSAAILVKYSPIPVIGITGTRGKSTTTQLIYEILNARYPGEIVLGGNIPDKSSLQLFDRLDNKKYLVLELSSFQLHGFHKERVSPQYALITNIYEDHLNRYTSLEEYKQDKQAVFKYQNDRGVLIYNLNNPHTLKMSKLAPGEVIGFSVNNLPTDLDPKILGNHNRENIAAAISISKILEIPDSTYIKVVNNFTGIPYRMQVVGTINGITFINDTTSTTPTSTIKAVEAVKSPTIIILGGESKNLPITDMITALKNSSHIKGIVILGSKNNQEFNNSLAELKQKILGHTISMPEAFKLSVSHATDGDTVLLSPGFASFDLFNNEFDRGDQFNQEVKNYQ